MPPLTEQQIDQQVKGMLRRIKLRQHSGMLEQSTKLVSLAPKNAKILSMHGSVNTALARHPEAIAAHASACAIASRNVDFRLLYARALQRGGKYEESLIEFERILYQRKDDFHAIRGKIASYTDLGRLEEALKEIKKAEKLLRKGDPTPNVVLTMGIARIRLAPDLLDSDEVLEQIIPAVEDERCDDHLRVSAYFQMGRVYEKLKRHDEAFACWAKTKTLKNLVWDPDEHSRRIDRLISCWSEDCGVPVSDIDGSRMIYILGMMRSGTSLTEQMIAQMPDVTPGGEMNSVGRRVSEVERQPASMFRPIPMSRNKYTKRVIDKITHDAWLMYNEVSRTTRITDKQPFNCHFVPLIARMFPGCKIIHCMRDPMDCCLSNYMQSFARPHPQTNDLYWLGRYYKDYERMMDAWRGLSLPNILDLQYEQLVDEPESESRRIAEFLEIDWTEEMLNHHESSRTIRTASREQVRKPIYKSSVKKYELYSKHLGELRRGLGIEEPAINDAGAPATGS